jgi:uncharacterized protein (TIGR02001 family)
MKHTNIITLLTLTAASALAQTATTASGPAITGNLGFTTDYVFRGLSQTDGKLAVQGGFDADFKNGFTAGVWASNVSAALGNLEVDLYANYGFKVGSVDVSVGYIDYTYSTAVNGGEANVSAAFSGLTLKISKGVSGYLSDYYYEAAYSYDIAAVKGLNLGLHYGSDAASSKYDYSLALTYPVFGFAGTLSYSDLEAGKSITAVTLKKTF